MTPAEFKQARSDLGLSQRQLADEWGMGKNGERSIRRWELGQVPVNPIAARLILVVRQVPEWRSMCESIAQ